ncbi:hypothetical protein [Paenibacillus mendelii]|uniref:Flagellar protein FliT n=1 Tax=Paenibacillus mendelii TaxID=206163 RepID=A0ABV6J4B4_9BACL|nr:hypothetical protein [Paenibacillus mendelii]MCQ6563567.1 hypothetical protein [Paenibacillus mendelii]
MAEEISRVPYERLVQLIEQRDRVLADLQDASIVEEADKVVIRKLAAYDELLTRRMAELKTEASEALHKMYASRQQKRAYESEMENSYFYDKKR